ncbi:hypothetical protein LS72_008825 [Helicobacter apodemus]|uniref:DUF7768 domain-containing protein n=1 Tax=Helicobacter apodemus TaxID=135569 RepID=A0A4U8UFU2_9HELI|nr:DUF4406 domain-containing protein [Helicobacter apodemus]TLE14495.1 hypothetical protein LS72_008825 [Helicobacter apodemus]
MKTKLVYIASPYTAVFDALGARSDIKAYDKAYSIAKTLSERGVRKVRERNGGKDFFYIPLSPVNIFTQIYGSNPYINREEVMQSCLGVLKNCDEVFVLKSDWTQSSLGIKEEVAFATSLGIPVLWE